MIIEDANKQVVIKCNNKASKSLLHVQRESL